MNSYIYNYVSFQNLLIRNLIDIISKLYRINESESLPEKKLKRIDEALVKFELTTKTKGLYQGMVDHDIFETEFVSENESKKVIIQHTHKTMHFEFSLN